MDAADVAARMDAALGARVRTFVRSAKRLYVRIDPVDLPEVAEWLLASLPGCRLATSTGIDLRDGVGLFHHFAVNGTPLVVTVKLLLGKPGPRAPSLAARHAAAEWIEREIAELVGVTFDGHPDGRRLLKDESMAAELPLRRGFDPARFKEALDERRGS